MTDSDQLAGVRAKIKRAEHHVRELNASFEGVREGNSDIIVGQAHLSGSGKLFKANLPIIQCWGAMIGDCVHNLRTCLDYIVCEAVLLNKRQVRKGKTGFPIAPSRKKFETKTVGKIKGTSQKMGQLVRRLKPYKGGIEPFWIIGELDNTDKHQMIVPVWTTISDVRVHKNVGGTVTEIATADPGRVDHGTKIIGTTDPFEGKHDIQFALDIAFGKNLVVEGQPVVPTLFQLVQFTERVVDIIDRNIFK